MRNYTQLHKQKIENKFQFDTRVSRGYSYINNHILFDKKIDFMFLFHLYTEDFKCMINTYFNTFM